MRKKNALLLFVLSRWYSCPRQGKIQDSDTMEGKGNTPVSYTHLDVYKRQEVDLLKYRPLAGSSYIPTPKKLLSKKALVNVQNLHDDKCFIWSVLAGLHPIASHPHRVSQYRQFGKRAEYGGCLLYTSRCV